MSTQDEIKALRFETYAGISMASNWIAIGDKREWVDFSCISEGKGQRRLWHVIAGYRHGAERQSVTVQMRKCFRYEACALALETLRNPEHGKIAA